MQRESASAERVLAAVAAGGPAVVPNPAPMAFGVVATTPRVVNAVKRRPLDQNVGVSVHDRSRRRELAPYLDVSAAVVEAVAELLDRRFTLLLPVRDAVPRPEWAAPAVKDGHVAVFDGRWSATAWLWDRFPVLYGSSANLTGRSPATSAREAAEMFGDDCVVAPTGEEPGPGQSKWAQSRWVQSEAQSELAQSEPASSEMAQRWSSTMLRIDVAGRLHLHRRGAQDLITGLPPSEFLGQLGTAVGLSAP